MRGRKRFSRKFITTYAAVKAHDREAAIAAWALRPAGSRLDVPTRKLPAGTATPPYHFRCRTITVAYWVQEESTVDRWTRLAFDREVLGRAEAEQLIERAAGAAWPHAKVVGNHFRKHGGAVGAESETDYTRRAVDLIRRGDRDVYLAIRKGKLNAVFARRIETKAKGKRKVRYEEAVVDVPNRKLLTFFKRKPPLLNTNDEVPIIKQPGRGIEAKK